MREVLALVVLIGVLVTGSITIVGAASKDGVVRGSIRIEGGVEIDSPAGPGSPSSGRVVFTENRHRALTIGVGKTGTFSVKLKPGTYRAWGGPPGWYPSCRGNNNNPFKVVSGQTVTIVVACVAL
jgi:hypothetical protein